MNFIADELAQEQKNLGRRYAMVGYVILWVLSLGLAIVRISQIRNVTKTYKQEITRVENKLEKLSPHFQKAVYLYQRKRQQQKKLTAVEEMAFEPRFILESLQGVTQTMPASIWLRKVHISALDGSETDDNKGVGASSIRSMIIEGNLYLNDEERNRQQIQEFKNALARLRPFAQAQARLDLSDMEVKRIANRYFYNFRLEYVWSVLYN